MNCAEFGQVVHELVRAQEVSGKETLSAAEVVSARFHAQTCDTCAGRLAEARSVVHALKILSDDSAGTQASPELGKSLVDAFREHQRTRERLRFRERRAKLRWAEWLAVAAAVLVFFGLGAWKLRRTGSHHAGIAKENPTAVQASGETQQPPDLEGLQGVTAQDSDFVPLPYAEDFPGNDSGMVIRVSMTRSALATLGYPVDESSGDNVVEADVIVGEDGWPRAVRLVQ